MLAIASPSKKTDAVPDTSKSGFSRLPEEVLAQIVAKVHDQYNIAPWKEKQDRVIKLCTIPSRNSSCDLWSYSLQGPPLLSTFQLFSTLDRQIHRMCQPLLWKTLKFPSKLPLPIGYWTENLLPKYGTHARSLTLSLSKDWFGVDLESDNVKGLDDDEELDDSFKTEDCLNLDPSSNSGKGEENLVLYSLMSPIQEILDSQSAEEFFRVTGTDNLRMESILRVGWGRHPDTYLSRSNATKVVSQCPDITRLDLHLPRQHVDDDDDRSSYCTPGLTATRLATLVSGMKNIRFLTLRGASEWTSQETIQVVKELPLLQSLLCGAVNTNVDADAGELFGKTISQLKHLTNLLLYEVACFENSWVGWSGPPRLTNLSIGYCQHVRPVVAARSINRFPGIENITHLSLCWNAPSSHQDGDEFLESHPVAHASIEFDPAIHSRHLFALPGLVELRLLDYSDEVLSTFRNCKTIRRLYYENYPLRGWSNLTSFICKSTWPLLKSLSVKPWEDIPPATNPSPQILLQSCCLQAGINLNIQESVVSWQKRVLARTGDP